MSYHSKNLSIHSIQLLIEPITPPNLKNCKSVNNSDYCQLKINTSITNTPGSATSNSKLWNDSTNLKNIGNLPDLFEKISLDKQTLDKDKPSTGKISKEYLNSINKLPLSSIKSEILKLSKDQYGCRFLQKKIDENLISNYSIRQNNFEIIFTEIYPHLYELIIDPFGNYLIQKLINYCSEANLNLILEILQYNLFQISINQHGTRALQKIIDNLNNNLQLSLLIKGLKPYIIELIKDLNGNHVIQKILNKYPPKDCQFIYDSIISDLHIVATHKHGCCVLQKCLNHVTSIQLNQFSMEILKFNNFELLINDQFGNYVLQYLISINSWEINYKVLQNFINFGLNNLCNLKFSSNVIEKFLKNCYNNEVLDINFSNLKFEFSYYILINDLNKLINDPYGNYVIQTLIDILINPQINYFNENGKLIAEKALMLLPENLPLLGLNNANLQIVIIKYWFADCKIVSSFGKRIQSKINMILMNGNSNNNHSMNTKQFRSKQLSVSSIPNSINYQNSNDFAIPDQRSFSLSTTPISNDSRINGMYQDSNISISPANPRFNDFIINENPFNYNGNSMTNNLTPAQKITPPSIQSQTQTQAQHHHHLSITSDLSLISHRSQSSIGSLTGLNQYENLYPQRNTANNNNYNNNINNCNSYNNYINSNNNNITNTNNNYQNMHNNYNVNSNNVINNQYALQNQNYIPQANYYQNQLNSQTIPQSAYSEYQLQSTQPIYPILNVSSNSQKDQVYY